MKRAGLNYSLVAAMIVSAVFSVSCNKDEGNDDNGKGNVQLLETVSRDGELEQKYEYDEQYRITKLILYSEDGKTVHNTRTFAYDQAGDLVSITDTDGDKDSFKKDGNKIIINDNEQQYLELNQAGVPVKWARDDSYGSSTRTMEYDGNGNLSKWTSIDVPGNTYVSAFTYDDKKSPLYNCKTPVWSFVWEDDLGFLDQEGTNKNNLLSIIDIEEDGSETSESSYTYTYDNDGYPLSIEKRHNDHDDVKTTFTLTYIKK